MGTESLLHGTVLPPLHKSKDSASGQKELSNAPNTRQVGGARVSEGTVDLTAWTGGLCAS